jgi:hypothetical protein
LVEERMASPTDVMNGDEDLPAARLRELARGVQLLLPDRRDPHLFHEQKSEIVADLRNLARGLESLPQARTGGHRSIQFHMKHPEQLEAKCYHRAAWHRPSTAAQHELPVLSPAASEPGATPAIAVARHGSLHLG